MTTTDERRSLLIRIHGMVKHYERQHLAGREIMRGIRYDLAVRATDLNGDDCRFPACGCDKADCANRPAVVPMTVWEG